MVKVTADFDKFGNNVTTSRATGNALFVNHSAEAGTVIRCCNVFTNAGFAQGIPFPVELYNVSVVATKKNICTDL